MIHHLVQRIVVSLMIARRRRGFHAEETIKLLDDKICLWIMDNVLHIHATHVVTHQEIPGS